VSCASRNREERNTGILADDAAVSSIRQEIADRENELLANEDDVFWTPSGTIWHGSTNCSYLSNSKIIYHGSVEEARLDGKERPCDRCAKTDVDRIYESLENNEICEGDVFFTRDSENFHHNINCEEICGADKIYYASEKIANSLGKLISCEKCETDK
jgi:hypothetical protein